jgi:regulator of sigma E protease
MIILIKSAQLLLALSILVIVHEFGHYIAARMFGVRVEKFYLFFDAWGKKLFSFKRGGTEYGVGIIPLGGYVKLTGMIDESMDKSFKDKEPQPYEFRSKPAWQRLIIMLGGIILNIVLGIIIFSFHTLMYGEKYIPAKEIKHGYAAYELGKEVGLKDGDILLAMNGKNIEKYPEDVNNPALILESKNTYTVQRNGEIINIDLPEDFGKKILNQGMSSFVAPRVKFKVGEIKDTVPAYTAGLRTGDSIKAINGKPVTYFNDLQNLLKEFAGTDIVISAKRENQILEIKTPLNSNALIGFRPELEEFATAKEQFSFGESFSKGTNKAFKTVTDNVRGLGRIFSGDLPANKSVSGLIGIGNAFPGTWNWEAFWALTAMLSMVLAFVNFLPIPALDGGHVIFLLVEMVIRRPLPVRFLEIAQTVGMVILLSLMAYALFNDFNNFVF